MRDHTNHMTQSSTSPSPSWVPGHCGPRTTEWFPGQPTTVRARAEPTSGAAPAPLFLCELQPARVYVCTDTHTRVSTKPTPDSGRGEAAPPKKSPETEPILHSAAPPETPSFGSLPLSAASPTPGQSSESYSSSPVSPALTPPPRVLWFSSPTSFLFPPPQHGPTGPPALDTRSPFLQFSLHPTPAAGAQPQPGVLPTD